MPAVPGRRRLAALAGLAVAASAPVLAAGYWLAAGVRGPVAAAGPQILPPFVASSSSGPDQTRTLVLRPDGAALSYTVLRDTDPVLGEPELPESSSATHALDGVVASLGAAAGGDGGDPGQALSQFDVGYVLLPAPVDQALAHQLDGSAGLVRLTTAPAYDLWQVAGTVARARVVGADGAVVPVPSGPVGVNTVVPPGTSGTLVLAEPAGGWSATLNGRPLAKLAQPVDGWAQGFVLPAGGGHLVITRNELARDLSLAAEAAAVLVVFALALPGTRSAVPAPAGRSESRSRPATPGPGRRRDRASRPKPARRKQFAVPGGRARDTGPETQAGTAGLRRPRGRDAQWSGSAGPPRPRAPPRRGGRAASTRRGTGSRPGDGADPRNSPRPARPTRGAVRRGGPRSPPGRRVLGDSRPHDRGLTCSVGIR